MPELNALGEAGQASRSAGSARNVAKQGALDVERGLQAPRDSIRSASQAAGLVTPVEGNSWLAGVPGLAKIDKWISAKNEPKFNQLIADDLGLKKGTAITKDELELIRDREAGAYRAITAAGDAMKHEIHAPSGFLDASGAPLMMPKQVSGFRVDPQFKTAVKGMAEDVAKLQEEFPQTFKASESSTKLIGDYLDKDTMTSAGVIRATRQLRKDAGVMMKSDDPAKLASAFTSKALANELENLMERNLEQTGQTELLARFRAARATIAKTYDVESALDNTGNVNARKLYVLSQKRPFSGNMKLVADYAGAFPEGAQKVASGRQTISPWDWMFGAGSIAAGQPLVAAGELAGRAGIPYLAQKGVLQKKTPTYQAGGQQMLPPLGTAAARAGQVLPPTGAAITGEQ
jgi:hypothetical protein